MFILNDCPDQETLRLKIYMNQYILEMPAAIHEHYLVRACFFYFEKANLSFICAMKHEGGRSSEIIILSQEIIAHTKWIVNDEIRFELFPEKVHFTKV